MAEVDLICNFKKCRKRLGTSAWVTSCSHAFCEEDGAKEFSRSSQENKCPACNSPLPGKYDIVKVDLNPMEQFKSMVLAGLRPEIVLDIATRAISFWNYQINQETLFQEAAANRYRERNQQLEDYYADIITKVKNDNHGLRRQLESTKRDLDNISQRAAELSEKLGEKTRQHQKLQAMYESLRRSTLVSKMFDQRKMPQHSCTRAQSPPTLGPQPLCEVFHPNVPESRAENSGGFSFQPVTPVQDARMLEEVGRHSPRREGYRYN